MLFSFIAFKQPRHLETVEINSHVQEVANPWYLFASPETLWRKWKLSTYWRSCMQYEIVCGVPCSLSNLTFELRGTRLFFLVFNLFIYFLNIIKEKKNRKKVRDCEALNFQYLPPLLKYWIRQINCQVPRMRADIN